MSRCESHLPKSEMIGTITQGYNIAHVVHLLYKATQKLIQLYSKCRCLYQSNALLVAWRSRAVSTGHYTNAQFSQATAVDACQRGATGRYSVNDVLACCTLTNVAVARAYNHV